MKIKVSGLDNLLESLKKWDSMSAQMAEHGWGPPMYLTPSAALQVEDLTPERLDQFFVHLYGADDREYFREVAKALRSRQVLQPWARLLSEALDAFERGAFAIVIPGLITILEGVLMKGQRATNVARVVRYRVRHENEKWADSVTAGVWRSCGRFIESLYAHSDFAGPTPAGLNRHWILHGRQPSDWSEADALRLIQALDALSTLLDH